jgi:hypothetical protein
MTDYRTLLEHDRDRIGTASFTFDDVTRRRDGKRRRQRITAGVVGIAVFVAAAWIVRDVASLDRARTVPAASPTTEPTATPSTYSGPTYTLGPVTPKDIALGDAFSRAWVDGDGEGAAATFSAEGTFDGFPPAILPALHDWFRAGGWTFGDAACGVHGWDDRRGVVGCTFPYENDLTRGVGLRPQSMTVSFVTDSGGIKTAWFGAGGDFEYNLFGWPNENRGNDDLFGDLWDMFLGWLSSQHPDDFVHMYDADRGYPILDRTSIDLWRRHTAEFLALGPRPASFDDWLAKQGFEVQARRICVTRTDEFWATKKADDLHGRAFDAAMAETSAATLAELRALPLDTEADRATMAAFLPLAERWIQLFRQKAAGEGPTGDAAFFQRRDLQVSMSALIDGCLVSYGLSG